MTTLLDTFDRTDNSSSLGTADSGQSWSALSGTWGIDTHQARLYSAATSQAVAVLNGGSGNGVLQCDIFLSATFNRADTGVIVRAADDNNYLLVAVTKDSNGTNNLRLFKKIAGTFTLLATALTGFFSNGVTYGIQVVAYGTSVKISVDGTLAITYTTSTGLESNTKYGLRINAAGTSADTGGSRFDNLSFFGGGSPTPPTSTGVGCVTDSFNRADTTFILGAADTGYVWETYNSSDWRVSSNKAYQWSDAVTGQAVCDLGHANVDASVDVQLGAVSAEAGLILCFVDANNYLSAVIDRDSSHNRVTFDKADAGVGTILAQSSTGLSLGSTHTLRCIVMSGVARVYLDDALLVSYTLTSGEAAKYIGTRQGITQHRTKAYADADDGSTRFDNFSACPAGGWGVGQIRMGA